MKIAFLSFYSGEVYRGVETYVQELSSRLKAYHEVVVYQGGTAPTIKDFTKNVLGEIDPGTDVIVATNGGWQSLLCKLWCIKNRKKLVIPGQSGPGRDDRINLFCRPDVFVALTNYQAGWARTNGFGVRVEIIPNGVDLEKFNPQVEPFKIDLPTPIILNVSALTKEKRLDLVIKAMAKTSGSLVLVGKGPQEEQLKKIGEELLPGRFKILSFSHDQMPPVFRAASLFTYATVPWESFGIVLLEAMASGLPVVATDDPIRREIVGEAGLFVNPENTQEYAKTIEKALELKWGDKPKKQAEKFSWDKITEEYNNLFQTLLS